MSNLSGPRSMDRRQSGRIIGLARASSPGERGPLGLAEAFATISGCVLLVCLAYAGGRWHAGWAPALYWAGEVLLLGAAFYFGLSRRTDWRARAGAVLLFAGAQSIISWSYSPDRFRYSDELQHVRTLLSILHTHHLFGANPSLPVSPQYPGLESATVAVRQTTGLSSFVSGLVVVGVAHLLLAAALLLLFRRLAGSQRGAAAAALIYMLGTDQAIIRLFVYEALALPFLVLALHFAVHASSTADPRLERRGWLRPAALAVACAAVVTVTHHVTAIALVILLGLIGVGLIFLRSDRWSGRRFLAIAGASFAMVAAWIGLVSPKTLNYLGGPLRDAAYGLFSSGGAGAGSAPGTEPGVVERAVSLSGPVLTVVFLLAGVGYVLLRDHRSKTVLRRVWFIGSLTYFVVLVIRVFAAQGTELAGRSLTYTSLFSALVVGAAMSSLDRPTPGPTVVRRGGARRLRQARIRRSAAAVAAILIGVSGLASAIPPAYERLPGRFHPDAFESGVDALNVSAARWSRDALGPNNHVFGDFTTATLWGTIGEQDTSRVGLALNEQFVAPEFDPKLPAAFTDFDIRYLVVDRRISTLRPVTGSYFATPDNAQERPRDSPLPASAVTKFNRIPGVSRVYDNGSVRVYDLREVSDAP